jgi:hypothetical protein
LGLRTVHEFLDNWEFREPLGCLSGKEIEGCLSKIYSGLIMKLTWLRIERTILGGQTLAWEYESDPVGSTLAKVETQTMSIKPPIY